MFVNNKYVNTTPINNEKDIFGAHTNSTLTATFLQLYSKMLNISCFNVFNHIVIFICILLSTTLFYDVIKKNISGESIQALLSQQNELLMPPSLTLCPATGFKELGTIESLFVPADLEKISLIAPAPYL